MDNRSICSSFSSRIATVIHLTVCDLTNCSHSQLHCVQLQTPALWRAGPRAERGLTPRLAPGTCLPTPCCDANRQCHGQRGTKVPSSGWPFTLANPSYSTFTPHLRQGNLFSLVARNCQNASWVNEAHGPPFSMFVFSTHLCSGQRPSALSVMPPWQPSAVWPLDAGCPRFSTCFHSRWWP